MPVATHEMGYIVRNEFFIMFMMIVALAALPLIIALWVYHDATNRKDPQAVAWTVGAALAWPVVLIVYLLVRGQRRQPPQG